MKRDFDRAERVRLRRRIERYEIDDGNRELHVDVRGEGASVGSHSQGVTYFEQTAAWDRQSVGLSAEVAVNKSSKMREGSGDILGLEFRG